MLYHDKYGNKTDKPEFKKPVPDGVTVQTVFDDYIKAIGGNDKVKAIDNAMMKGKMSAMGQSLDVEMVMSQNNKSFMQISMPGMTIMKSAFDGEKGYNEMQGQRKDMTADEIENAKMTEYLFTELKGGSNFELVGLESTEEGDAYVIQTTENEKSFYSVETGLKIKDVTTVEQGGQTMETTIKYGDYNPVEGVLFPNKITQSVGPQNFEIMLTDVMVNQDIPADKFQ
jgi:hypothetical protein